MSGKDVSEELHDPTEPDMSEIDWGPKQRPLDNGEPCPECGHEFDHEEWDVRHLQRGDTLGETWIYTCPSCEQETCKVGT